GATDDLSQTLHSRTNGNPLLCKLVLSYLIIGNEKINSKSIELALKKTKETFFKKILSVFSDESKKQLFSAGAVKYDLKTQEYFLLKLSSSELNQLIDGGFIEEGGTSIHLTSSAKNFLEGYRASSQPPDTSAREIVDFIGRTQDPTYLSKKELLWQYIVTDDVRIIDEMNVFAKEMVERGDFNDLIQFTNNFTEELSDRSEERR